MKETTKLIEQVSDTKCLDIDAQDNLDFIAITENKKIVSSTFQNLTDLDIRFPIIRRLDFNKFLLIDSRTKKGRPNAWVIRNDGYVEKTFMAGDGIEDVLIQQEKIIITYFDEGVLGDIEPSDQGLVVFDFDGNILFNYRNRYGYAVDIVDCYCLCPKGSKAAFFLMYPDFPLIELNLETFIQKVHALPNELNGAGSITNRGTNVYFHSPYKDKRGIYKWMIGSRKTEKIGEYSPHLRGLRGGKFLSFGERGYTIIDLNE